MDTNDEKRLGLAPHDDAFTEAFLAEADARSRWDEEVGLRAENERLEDALRKFAFPTHAGHWRCPVCYSVVTRGEEHARSCAVKAAFARGE